MGTWLGEYSFFDNRNSYAANIPHALRRWTNLTMFRLRVHSATNGFLSCSENMVAIVTVDHFANHRHVSRTLLRSQPINSIEFVGPDNVNRCEVLIIVAYVSYALGLFKPGFVFFQVSRQGLAFFLCSLAFGDVRNHAIVLEVAGAISSCVRDQWTYLKKPSGRRIRCSTSKSMPLCVARPLISSRRSLSSG